MFGLFVSRFMNLKKFISIHLCAAMLFGLPVIALCQTALLNPSFEGVPQEAKTPAGWFPHNLGTTPDILPGVWGVQTPPKHGNTYMGLITRVDGTWESVGQQLATPLVAGTCYTFSIHLARSNTYVNYNMPVRLRIWAGTGPDSEIELLSSTEAIEHLDWKKYEFSFTPSIDAQWFVLEAYFASGYYFGYNGNLLVDACSEIKPCRRAAAPVFRRESTL